MTTRAPTPPVDEHELYPIHEEDDVPETGFHEEQTRYLRDALATRFPEWQVSGNVCIYWVEGNFSLYLAPDVFVTHERPPQPARVHLLWRDQPVVFAAEIGSRSTLRTDEGPKLERYAEGIRPLEYLYADPPHAGLRLWRLGPQGYVPVEPDAGGRFHSEELGLQFGLEDEFLWLYTLEGERLRTHEESEQARQEAEQALRAAEQRAREEAEQRLALQRRVAELQAELERRQPRGRRGG